MDIAKAIKQARKKQKLTQSELAESAGLSLAFINQLENGKKSPTLKSLEKISQALGIPFPVLSFLSLDENDIPSEKRSAFKVIGPSIQAMIEEFFFKPEA